MNLKDLSLDELLKVNEYREIKESVEELYFQEEQAKVKAEAAKGVKTNGRGY